MIPKNKLFQITLFFKKFCNQLLQIVLSVSVLLIGCVLPLYFENGFSTIGTDKHSFFRFVGTTTMYMAIVLLILKGAADLFLYYGFQEKEQAEQWWKKEVRLSVTDKFLLLYAASVLLSFLFSSFRKEALWGTNGWFMGMLPQFLFLGYYVLLSRVWERVEWIWYIFMGCSSVSFLLGILNRFSIYPLDMHSRNTAFISTIGNMNWFCGWWAACVFLGIVVFWMMQKEEGRKEGGAYLPYGIRFSLLTAYMALALLIGLLQGSDSGFLALFAGLLVLLFLSAKEVDRMIRFWEIALLLCLLSQGIRWADAVFPNKLNQISGPLKILITGNRTLVLAVICLMVIVILKFCRSKNCYPARAANIAVTAFLVTAGIGAAVFLFLLVSNTLHPGSIGKLSEWSAFTFDGYWGSMRGSTWVSGLWAFGDQNWLHKLIGIGPDCMSAYIYSGANVALEEYTNYWMGHARLTNAHGEWITTLLNMGILGLIGYAGAIISGIVRFIRNRKVHWFVAAAALCLISYTANNLFSFQQTNNTSAIFLIWGIAEGFVREKKIT